MSVITVVSSAETRQPRLFAFELRRIKNPADPIAFMMASLLRHPVGVFGSRAFPYPSIIVLR